MPSLVATMSALTRPTCVHTHFVRTKIDIRETNCTIIWYAGWISVCELQLPQNFPPDSPYIIENVNRTNQATAENGLFP